MRASASSRPIASAPLAAVPFAAVPFATLVFLCAFSLFVVQPMLGKSLLPEWGGAASVWTTCLLFFQSALWLGYAYAHALTRWLDPKRQLAVHVGFLVAAAVWLLAAPPLTLAPDASHPSLAILEQLTWSVGLPFVILSSASPLMASWWSRLDPQGTPDRRVEPYRLVAISNLGSLLGCLAYPFVIEPTLGLEQQRWCWRIVFVSLVASWIWLGLKMVGRAPALSTPRGGNELHLQARASFGMQWLWVGLSACTAIVLASCTQQSSQAGVVVPGLWVLPLAIYLITWWAGFRWPVFGAWGWHTSLYYFGSLLALALLIGKLWFPWWAIVAGNAGVVACVGLACHGLLYAVRPHPDDLTAFSLALASGGVLGTAFVSLGAPAWFSDYWELHVGLGLGAIAIAWYDLTRFQALISVDVWVRRWVWPMTSILAVILLLALWTLVTTPGREETIVRLRDFYGVVSAVKQPSTNLQAMVLGQTIHGVEPLEGTLEPDRTLYFRTDSGVAWAWGWCHHRWDRPLRVGLVGLGTGSLSLYARRQDVLTYYEISPAVRRIAETHFRYLRTHAGETHIRMGDGRRLIQEEVARGEQPPLDLLILDAFANDALPLHLLTVEALENYQRRLGPEGVIAIQITNRNLDLAPILFASARKLGLNAWLVETEARVPSVRPGVDPQVRQVRWMVFFPPGTSVPPWPGAQSERASRARPWTDDYASPFQALR